MSETVPEYNAYEDYRYRLVVSLRPKGEPGQGKRTNSSIIDKYKNPTLLNLEIADAELLSAEWQRSPNAYEQEAARSIRAALREREEYLTKKDQANAEE